MHEMEFARHMHVIDVMARIKREARRHGCMPISNQKWTCSYIVVVPAAGNIDVSDELATDIALYRKIL